MTDLELIESLTKLDAEATPGPWVSSRDGITGPIRAALGRDAALIAAMRNGLPRLLELARYGVRIQHSLEARDLQLLQQSNAATYHAWSEMRKERDALEAQSAEDDKTIARGVEACEALRAERDRLLAALKAEAIARAVTEAGARSVKLGTVVDVGGIAFVIGERPATGEEAAMYFADEVQP